MLVPAASLVFRPLTVSCWSVTLLAPVIWTPTGLPVIVATLVATQSEPAAGRSSRPRCSCCCRRSSG